MKAHGKCHAVIEHYENQLRYANELLEQFMLHRFDTTEVQAYAERITELENHIRRLNEMRVRAFKQGFATALEFLEEGASLEDLRERYYGEFTPITPVSKVA